MVSGYKKISGVLYYFGKKSGKAPAITDGTRKYKGMTYYFSSEGKGFISVNNKKGNMAVAKIFDECKLKNTMNKKKKLEILYRQVMKRSSYLGIGEPDLMSSWVSTYAFEMVKWSSGNCYSYASIIGLLAKAEGYNVEIYIGKCNRNSSDATEHSWVVVDKKYVLDGIFEDLDYHDNGRLKFFFQSYDQLKSSVGYEYFPDSAAN